MSGWDFDLLGDAIPEGHGRKGRPPHNPTLENRRKVILLAAFDKNEEQIAAALSITPPTLRKHYFRELRSRLEARHRVEGKLLAALLGEVDKGNVSAIDKLFKRLDKHDLGKLAQRVADRGNDRDRTPPPVGKKQSQKDAAKQVGGKFAPPPAPRLIN